MTDGWGAGYEAGGAYGADGGYGAYGSSWPAGPGYGPTPESGARGGAMAAFVTSAIITAMCCGVLVLPALVCSGVALSRVESDPESARSLTKWSWICLGGAVALVVLFMAAMIIIGVSGGFDESNDPY